MESGITKIARTGRFAIQVRSNQDRSHFLVLYLTRRTLYDLDNGIFISKYLPHRTEPIPCPHAHPRLRLGAGSTRHTSMSLPCPCGVVQGKISHQVLTMILKVDALTQKEPIYIPIINWTLPLRWCKAIANRLKKIAPFDTADSCASCSPHLKLVSGSRLEIHILRFDPVLAK